MKNIHKTALLTLSSLMMFSCQIDEIETFKELSSVHLTETAIQYSFMESLDMANVVLKVPVRISGLVSDKDRVVTVKLADVDSLTTADPKTFNISNGVVEANSYTGYVEIELAYAPALDTAMHTVALELEANEDFTDVSLESRITLINFTNQMVQPENWNGARNYFGPRNSGERAFSVSWYKFILENIDNTYLPFWQVVAMNPGQYPNHAEKYHWSIYEAEAWRDYLKSKLEEYNDINPDNPLIHDSGVYEGEEVLFW